MNNILKLVLAFVLCVGLAAPANAQDAAGVDESGTASDDGVIIDNGGIDLSEDEETSRPGYPARRLPNIKEKQEELRALHTEKREAAQSARAERRTEAQNARTEKRNSIQDARSGVDGGGDHAADDGGDNERRNDEDRFYPHDGERRAEMKEKREEKRAEVQENREERKAEMDEKRKARRMEIAEKLQERADKFLDRVVDRFKAAIERVRQIASRVESRLTKIQDEKGADLSKALSLVDEAYAALNDAEAALAAAADSGETVIYQIQNSVGADVDNAANVLQTQVRPSFDGAKDKFRAVHEHIKRAHSLLREAVEAAKAALRDGRDNSIDNDTDGSVSPTN